jgi:antitoxin ParD1/3/4
LEELVQARIRSGRYNSPGEVVGEALRLLEERDTVGAIHVKEPRSSVRGPAKLRSRIDDGLNSLDRGEGVDGEKFMQEMLDGTDSQEAQRKAS